MKLLAKLGLTSVPDEIQEYRPVERKEILAMQDRQFLSDYITWGWYIDRAGGVYETVSGIAVIFEVIVPSYMAEQHENLFETLLREVYPPGTVIDFFCFASGNIKPLLDLYRESHRAKPNLLYPERLQEIIENRVRYYHESSKGSLWKDTVARPRVFRNFISFYFPYNENDPDRLWTEVDILVPKIKSQLSTMGFHPLQVSPSSFITVMREIFNPGFEGVAAYNPHREIRRQIIMPDTVIEIADDAGFADLRCIREDSQHYIRVMSVNAFPERMTLWEFNNLIFPYDRKFVSKMPYPFALSMSVRIGDWKKTKEKFMKKAMFGIHQADNNPLAKFFPKIQIKAQYSRYVMELLEDNKVPVEVTLSSFFIAPTKDELNFYASEYDAIMKRIGFEIAREVDVSIVPQLLEMLPANHLPDRMEFLKKYSSMFDVNACTLIPLIGAEYGTETPAAMYIDRKMQLSFFDIFNSKTNFNTVKVAESGGGKSVSEADFHIQHLAMGRVIRVIDIGWSYKPLCEVLGGEYIEIDDRYSPCFNPFTDVMTDENGRIHEDEYETLIPLIGILAGVDVSASLRSDTTDNIVARYAGIIYRAIEGAWNKAIQSGRDPHSIGLMEVGEELKDMEDVSGENIARKLYEAIYPYSHGQYSRYFNGRNNINYTKDYVILEMEQLEQKEMRLKGAILFSLIAKVLDEFFLGFTKGDKRQKILIIDEAWSLLKNISAASFMEAAARRFRKYGCSLVVITQSIQDLYASPTTMAIYENSAHLVMLKQKAETLSKMMAEGKIILTPFAETMVKSLTTEPGKYSEMYIKSNVMEGTVRLILDRLTYWLTTTSAKDKALREEVMKRYGFDLWEACKFLAGTMRIGEVLLRLGYISERQLEYALRLQEEMPSKRLGEILVEMGAITPQQLKEAMEERLKRS